MKTELENNELLGSVYGCLVPNLNVLGKKWTNFHFETTNGVNVVARGAGKGRGVNIKNQRPTKIIADDIEEDEQVSSADRRLKLHNWLYNVIFNSLDKERGRIKMIGTVLHLQSEIKLFYNTHGGIFKKAIENGKSIWPDYWSLEALEKQKKKVGSRAFAQEFMNNPADKDLANFDELWIVDNYYTTLPETKNYIYYNVLTIDPQAGEKNTADEYAITNLTFCKKDSHRYVKKQICGRGGITEQAKKIIKEWYDHKDTTLLVGVEKVLNQTALFQTIVAWKNYKIEIDGIRHIKDRNIPLIAISPRGKDKKARLEVHEPAIERGEIHLRPEMETLKDQLLFLGTKLIDHDDRADSLVMALDLSYRGIKNKGPQKESDEEKDSNETVAGNMYKTKY